MVWNKWLKTKAVIMTATEMFKKNNRSIDSILRKSQKAPFGGDFHKFSRIL